VADRLLPDERRVLLVEGLRQEAVDRDEPEQLGGGGFGVE